MDDISNLLQERLKKSFKSYFIHGVEHLISSNQTEENILQVIINIQASLEILSKLYVLRTYGWEKIIDKKFHSNPSEVVIEHIKSGTIKTSIYNSVKNTLLTLPILDNDSRKLLSKFQNYRNQVMHLGMNRVDISILDETIWLIINVINVLDWQTIYNSRHGYLSNSMRSLLGQDTYNRLLETSAYVEKAKKNANDFYDEVRYCIICGNDTLVVNKWDYDYKCLVCGCKVPDDESTNYIDCPFCNKKGTVIYDALNIHDNTSIQALCCSCREHCAIYKCKTCDSVYPLDQECDFCKEE